jgi:Tfp pilus assembly protein PilX
MMQNTKKGFTLFIAILIGSLMLAIGFSIFNLTFKELLLTASARESQVAFYAADTGLECALYYDQRGNQFVPGQSATVSCILPGTSVISSGSSGNATWTWSFEVSPDVCAKVQVNKVSGISVNARTTIRSFGYNTCDDTSPKRTERGLQVTYGGI